MSRGKSRRLSTTQRAVVELRKHRQWTQAQLAQHMGLALNTISRWESIRPPRGLSLLQLHGVASEFGRSDLVEIFALQMQAEIKQVGTLLPVWNPLKPLENALRHLVAGNPGMMRSPRLTKAYRRVISAITTAHAELIREATARGYERQDLADTQEQLERIDEFEGER